MYYMKKNKEYVKKVTSYHAKGLCLFVVIIFAFLLSCGSDDEDSTTVVLEEPELNTPIIQSPTPLIHLADNLDEQDQLGWCIDTQGNGFNENLKTLIWNKVVIRLSKRGINNISLVIDGIMNGFNCRFHGGVAPKVRKHIK